MRKLQRLLSSSVSDDWILCSQNSEYCFLARAPSSKLHFSNNFGSVTTWLSVTTSGVEAPLVLVKWISFPPNYWSVTTKQTRLVSMVAYSKICSTGSPQPFWWSLQWNSSYYWMRSVKTFWCLRMDHWDQLQQMPNEKYTC